MTPIELMAFFVAALGLLKMLVIMVNPKNWMPVVKGVYGNAAIAQLVGLALGGLSLWYLLQELSIVHIFAVMFFFMMIMLVTVTSYSKEMMGLANKLLKDPNALKRAWLGCVIWLALTIWVLWALFA